MKDWMETSGTAVQTETQCEAHPFVQLRLLLNICKQDLTGAGSLFKKSSPKPMVWAPLMLCSESFLEGPSPLRAQQVLGNMQL